MTLADSIDVFAGRLADEFNAVRAELADATDIDPPATLTAVSGVITPDATAGSVFRHVATANVTLAEPTGGVDGQAVVVAVLASGADRVLTVAGGTVTIPSGRWWVGELRYDATTTTWLLDDGSASSSGGGSPAGTAGGVLSGSYPNPGFAVDMATQSELDTGLAGKQAADPDLTTIAALDATTAGALTTDGGGWIRKTYAQLKTALALVKGDVGLGNVDNTADTAKPVSTATQTALDGKAPAAVAVSAQTASYTLVLADAGKAVEVTAAGATTVTVPRNSSVAFPVGTVIEVARLGAGAVTLAAGAGVTLQQRTGATLGLAAQYSVACLRKRATDVWLISGDTA